MYIANLVSLIITLIGGVNWFLVGAFNFNLVDFIFSEGSFMSRSIYVLVGVSTIFIIISLIMSMLKFPLTKTQETKNTIL